MQYDRLITGLAGVLGAITIAMAVLGVAYNPAILFVALTFGAATYLVYYHTSGRMAARVSQTVERQAATRTGNRRRRRQRVEGSGRDGGGFGAGPREEWTPPRNGATAREAASGGGHRGVTQRGQRHKQRTGTRQSTGQRQGQRRTRQRRRAPQASSGPSAAEAYRTLGLDPDADEDTVKRAYRERVKDVHPDADAGDEEEFKAVTAAYERLTD